MSQKFILIDYENVQPKNFELLAKHSFHVYIFFGLNQVRVSRDFLKSILALQEKAEIVEVSGNGKNALDFHVAYYLGRLAQEHPGAQFHVISKDTGFDTLIKHLKGRGVNVGRVTDLAEIPQLRLRETTSDGEKITAIVANLASRGQSRPRKVSTLQNTINTLFTKKLPQKELQKLVNELESRGFISIRQSAVSYSLPDP